MKATSTNLVPFARLFWKEYRSVRGFWISLVALVVLIQLITVAFSQDSRDSMGLIYNFALGAPAFFAIGCAGAAFAMEQEDGTFEFLRAGPVTSRQVFVSKLAIAFCATLAMFSLLLPIAMWLMHGELPDAEKFSGMLGLWLVASAEAIAWGTLFSLLTARPLLAICLAVAATSTVAHMLAWTKATGSLGDFSYAPYLQVAPWRLVVAGLVLAVDVYLGRQWLQGVDEVRPKRKTVAGQNRSSNTAATATNNVAAHLLATKPDRSAMLGHLVWQHLRQSGWLMAILTALVFVAVMASRMIDQVVHGDERPMAIPMIVLAVLMGCCMFLADQEKRRYRFFVEHNAPPRYVWFTRQMLWLPVVIATTLYFCWRWIADGNWSIISWEIQLSTNHWLWRDHVNDWRQLLHLPPVVLVFACVAVSYATGQWASMFVRSGLMAAFVGAVLSALLCGWTLLMDTMRVSFWWSVWPIPLLLIFATWLRAPDWIRENTSWNARLRAAAVLLIPTTALLVAVPNYRVRQIPAVRCGFDPAAYVGQITPAGLAVGELYRQASDTYEPLYWKQLPSGEEARPGRDTDDLRRVTEEEVHWLDKNKKSIALMLEAAQRSTCYFQNPQSLTNLVGLRNSGGLIDLIVVSARQLEAEGKLSEAMDRYFTGLKIAAQWSDHANSNEAIRRKDIAQMMLYELREWGAQKNQTSEQLTVALHKLQAINTNLLRNDDSLKSDYIVTQRYLQGDEKAHSAFYDLAGGKKQVQDNLIWSKLMPWENHRALRLLNLLTTTALSRFQTVLQKLEAEDNQGVVNYIAPLHRTWPFDPAAYLEITYGGYRHPDVRENAEWFETTNPNLRPIGEAGTVAIHAVTEFEANRRATMLVLALQAYRLEHGELPQFLSELIPDFGKLPCDPYSGQYFRYFPEGLRKAIDELPQNTTSGEDYFALPGIWCMGPQLRVPTLSDQDEMRGSPNEVIVSVHEPYYELRVRPNDQKRSFAQVWTHGMWFPIPEPQK
jgi:hypothetical protein